MHNTYTRIIAFLLLCGMVPSASAFSDLDILQAIEQKNIKYVQDCLTLKESVINLRFGDAQETPLMYAIQKLVVTTKSTEKRFAPSMGRVGLGFLRMMAGIGTTFAGLGFAATSAAAARNYNKDLFDPITNDGTNSAEKNSVSNFGKRAWSFFWGEEKANNSSSANKTPAGQTPVIAKPEPEVLKSFRGIFQERTARREGEQAARLINTARSENKQNVSNTASSGKQEVKADKKQVDHIHATYSAFGGVVSGKVNIPPAQLQEIVGQLGDRIDRFTDETVAQLSDVVDAGRDAFSATNVNDLNTTIENAKRLTTTFEQKFRAYDTAFLLAGTITGVVAAFYGLKWGAQGIYRMFNSTAGTYNHTKDIDAYRELIRTLLDNKSIDLSLKDKYGKTTLERVQQAMVECMGDKDSYALLRDIEAFIKLR